MSTQAAALSWRSPESSTGSFFYALLLHGVVILVVVGYFTLHRGALTVPEMQTIDLGYQEFDEPPPPAKEIKTVRHSEPAEKVPAQKVQDNQPKELQDEKSDVAGTQKAAPTTNNIGNNANGNAEATPYYRIKPKYPREALVAGKEGWVQFKIDVSENGDVENIRLVDGEERNTFQSEAKRALAQWKYKPFTDASGKIVKKIDHLVRIDFKLKDAAGGPDMAAVNN